MSLASTGWAADTGWEKIVFTDEKLFTVEQAHNHQNDRNWSTEAPGPSSIVKHCQNPRSVMVWGGICASGKTPLIFIDQGVKINKEVYRRDILEAPGPSSTLEWPPYSPDLNPLDYRVWSILKARACAKRHKTLESLKQALRREWDRITVDELRPIAQNILKRLSLRIRAKGGHFETG
ncbi:uncharacterized protein LOC128857534 [Anastrepha ludens]|uniref:uncharacterized protein LOC128857534 n=1 Tax=Anastrepha ludens TaxID=28586 RepID=UPI0023AECC30|nr:uncharacterized protein LOC128857534 [Anastrepha ludens]